MNRLYNEDLEQCVRVKNIEHLFGKTLLITGARGMIASTLIDALEMLNLTRDARINIIATTRAEYDACKDEGFTRIPNSEFRIPNYILPMASNTHPLAYSQQPVETMITNLNGARHALELARETGAKVLYPSTVEVYGNSESGSFKEVDTGQLNLNNARACYTESKRAAEALCQSYAAEYGVQVTIARLCRVFGPRVLPTDTKASSQFLQCAVNQQDIVLKSEGQQLFSYIYVADAVNAILHLMLNGENARAYNISIPECDVRLAEFAKLCAETAGTKVVFDLPSDTERKGYSIANTALLDNGLLCATGWAPRYTMRQAIERTVLILNSKI